MSTEKVTRRKVRRDFRAKLAAVEMFCRVNLEVLDTIKGEMSTETSRGMVEGQQSAYRSVLRNIGAEAGQ